MSWQDKAICKNTSDKIFFPPDSPSAEIIAAMVAEEYYCRYCPVKINCLKTALITDSKGIWAGTTTEMRTKIRRIQNRKKCPVCENEKLISVTKFSVCLSCGVSWKR